MISEYLNYWFSIKGIERLIQVFEKEKFDIRFIGGCVRDAFIGRKSSDIDFAVNCNPNKTSELLYKNNISILDYGKKFGTITAIIDKNKFEITSLREDKNQTGRYTEVLYTKSWYKDALRRDFTCNAININPKGKVEDYFDGQQDIRFQQIKFINNIEEKIEQDYLRVIRFFRFLGLFNNLRIIEGYEKILYNNLSYVRKNVSNNRIKIELLKMLNNKFKFNSILDSQNNTKANLLIESIREWWKEDSYDLGLKECINKIDILIANKK